MPRIGSRTLPPQILVASHHTGPGAELQQLVERQGYTVLRTYTGAHTLERVRTARPRPDVVILDDTLPDLESYDASSALRDDPAVGPGAPILLLTAGHPAAAEHATALRAGVWEFLSHPFNAEEVVTKLQGYVRLKLDADRVRQENVTEDEMGFSTVRGLALRAQELTLQAFHHGAALACVALAPVAAGAATEAAAAQLFARVLQATHRRSDAIGRLGPGEFAVIAPGTDAAGAVGFARRVATAFGTGALRAGFDAVGNARYAPIEPKNLLARATSALRAAKTSAATDWIQAFPGV